MKCYQAFTEHRHELPIKMNRCYGALVIGSASVLAAEQPVRITMRSAAASAAEQSVETALHCGGAPVLLMLVSLTSTNIV